VLLFEGLCLKRLCIQVRVDFRLIGVVIGKGRMNLRQREMANLRAISSGIRPMLCH